MDDAQLIDKALSWLGIGADLREAGQPDYDAALLVVPAVVSWASSLPSAPVDGAWTPAAELGLVMLSARLIRRRNSPGGVEALTADGVAYVRRTDPDVVRLLGLDVPMVG